MPWGAALIIRLPSGSVRETWCALVWNQRFVNDYSILRSVRVMEGSTVAMTPLALWAIIETRWPGLADHLRSCPEAITRVTPPGGDPPQHLEKVPAELRDLFSDEELRHLVYFQADGGPLSPGLIAQCCGSGTPERQDPSAGQTRE